MLLNMGRLAEGAEDARRSLAMARELGYLVAEGMALGMLGIAALYSGDYDGAVRLIRQKQLISGVPAWVMPGGSPVMIGALIDAGDLAAAESACAAALARCRDAGDLLDLPHMLMLMADLDVQAGRFQDAAAHLREGLQIAVRAGDLWDVAANGLWSCALLCTATGRYAEATTVWAAGEVHCRQQGFTGGSPEDARREEEALRTIRQALGPARARAAEERGAAMSLDTAAEYALMLTAPAAPPPAAAGPGLGRAQRPGTGTGHPGRPGPHQRPDRRAAVHQRPHGRLAPGPDPGQDRLPPPRRPDPAGPDRGTGLTSGPPAPGTRSPPACGSSDPTPLPAR